jgi:hypothetical protein
MRRCQKLTKLFLNIKPSILTADQTMPAEAPFKSKASAKAHDVENQSGQDEA